MRSKISKRILSETSQETKDKVNEYANKLVLSGVSIAKRTFNSEEELLQFIYLHVPFAVKPISKTAKTKLVPTFTSRNAFEQVCKELAKKLFNEC